MHASCIITRYVRYGTVRYVCTTVRMYMYGTLVQTYGWPPVPAQELIKQNLMMMHSCLETINLNWIVAK